MEEAFKPISAAELADIDAQYVPFPSFSEWPTIVPRKELWDRDYERFMKVSAEASGEDLRTAQQIALRTAAFDTGAIEGLYPTDRGLTFTVATQAAAWEQEVEDRDSNALRLFEAQLEAFELVMDLVAEQFPKMTQSWVRRLHEVVTAEQETFVVHTPVGPQEQPLPRGSYKEHPNHVRTIDGAIHAYAPVGETQSEMQRLIDELEAEDFKRAHSILQSSYVHYALVAIHPFADGNGRVARAMASAYTYRSASVPLLVLAHHRDQYFAALSEADEGRPDPFVDFIARVSRDGLEMVTERLRAAQAAQPEEVLDAFREMYIAQGDLSHRQLDELANGFVDDLLGVIASQGESLDLPDGVKVEWMGGAGGDQGEVPDGFRSLVTPGPRYVQLDFEASAPGDAEIRDTIDVFVSTASDTATSVMVRARRTGDQLTFGQFDLSPHLSSAARLRMESFVRRIIGNILKELLEASKARLQQKGY
jgi:Fic family protein